MSILTVLSMLASMLGATLSFIEAGSHVTGTSVSAHDDGSQCPDPCSDGHDCDSNCSCVCCHARLLATHVPFGFVIAQLSPLGERVSPPPTDPRASGISRRIFHPPRA